jgi:hypothetical protein
MTKSTDPWWAISAGTPGGQEGERDGFIQAPDEESARTAYLAQRPEGWAIFSIAPRPAPKPYVPPKRGKDEEHFEL